MLERLNQSSSSTSNREQYFVLMLTSAENPHSQRYDVAKGRIVFKAFWDNSGYSCEACVQNLIKLTLGYNIFNVVSLVSSMNWFISDVNKFNESMSVRNGLETHKKFLTFKSPK